MENLYSIVMDVGQSSTKVGFGGENQPRYTFFTITGSPKYKAIGVHEEKQLYVGNEIMDSLGLYKILLTTGGKLLIGITLSH